LAVEAIGGHAGVAEETKVRGLVCATETFAGLQSRNAHAANPGRTIIQNLHVEGEIGLS
jgi:hypothetical protein